VPRKPSSELNDQFSVTRVLGNPGETAFPRRASGVVAKVLGYRLRRGRPVLLTARTIYRHRDQLSATHRSHLKSREVVSPQTEERGDGGMPHDYCRPDGIEGSQS